MYLAPRSVGRNVVVRRSVRRSLALDATLEPGRFRSIIPSAGILAPFAQFVRISTGALRATIRIPALMAVAFERLMAVAEERARAVCAVSTGNAAVTALSPHWGFVVAGDSIAEHDAPFVKRSTPVLAQHVQGRLLPGRIGLAAAAVARPTLFRIRSLTLDGIGRRVGPIKTREVKGLQESEPIRKIVSVDLERFTRSRGLEQLRFGPLRAQQNDLDGLQDRLLRNRPINPALGDLHPHLVDAVTKRNTMFPGRSLECPDARTVAGDNRGRHRGIRGAAARLVRQAVEARGRKQAYDGRTRAERRHHLVQDQRRMGEECDGRGVTPKDMGEETRRNGLEL